MRIGIITGSGTYALPDFEDARPVEVETEFGPATVTEGRFGGVDALHISRHQPGHPRLSHQVTHQANIAALRDRGAEAILAVTVCGAVDKTVPLGSLIVFDDLHFLANRLPDGSICTLHTEPGRPGRAHWVFDTPFSPALRGALLAGAREAGLEVRDGGCYGHVDGPRFNTKAEIRSLAAAGVTAVSQTAGPETVLAGEAEIPFALLGYATDYANGVEEVVAPVEQLVALLERSPAAFAETLRRALPKVAAPDLTPVGSHFRFD
jgi:purine nucleoside phosphorylase